MGLTFQAPPQQAVFPDVPRNEPFITKEGFVNPLWSMFFDNLVMALQVNFKPEGIAVPQLPTTEINKLTRMVVKDGNVITSVGDIIYDSTTNQFKGNINGTWKIFTLT